MIDSAGLTGWVGFTGWVPALAPRARPPCMSSSPECALYSELGGIFDNKYAPTLMHQHSPQRIRTGAVAAPFPEDNSK